MEKIHQDIKNAQKELSDILSVNSITFSILEDGDMILPNRTDLAVSISYRIMFGKLLMGNNVTIFDKNQNIIKEVGIYSKDLIPILHESEGSN